MEIELVSAHEVAEIRAYAGSFSNSALVGFEKRVHGQVLRLLAYIDQAGQGEKTDAQRWSNVRLDALGVRVRRLEEQVLSLQKRSEAQREHIESLTKQLEMCVSSLRGDLDRIEKICASHDEVLRGHRGDIDLQIKSLAETDAKVGELLNGTRVLAPLVQQAVADSDTIQLMKFYGVTTLEKLVKVQANHVARLQAKMTPPLNEVPGYTPRAG